MWGQYIRGGDGNLVEVTSMWSPQDVEHYKKEVQRNIDAMPDWISTLVYRYFSPRILKHETLLDALNYLAYVAAYGEAYPVAMKFNKRIIRDDRLSRLYWRREKKMGY